MGSENINDPTLEGPSNPKAPSEGLPAKNKERKIVRLAVDRDLCIGAANCVAIAPEAFELDNENIATIKASFEELPDDVLLQAAEACPTKAITLYDKDGKRLYPPKNP